MYVTDYSQRPQQVIGLGHQTQAFIQMPLIFMNGDVIWTCKQIISEAPSFSVMLRYKYTRNEESFYVNPDLHCINFNITMVFFIKMKWNYVVLGLLLHKLGQASAWDNEVNWMMKHAPAAQLSSTLQLDFKVRRFIFMRNILVEWYINLVISTTFATCMLYAQIDACMCAYPMCRACIYVCAYTFVQSLIVCMHVHKFIGA